MSEFIPFIILAIGIAIVLGMIIGLRINAFIALLTAAIVVSLMAVDSTPEGGTRIAGDAIKRVADAFGSACAGIAIVIALAAVIGTCMMDSGAADRIVRAFMNLLGEKRSPWALMGSGYVLAVPVFFDTVFYLLVPLARSFYRRTGGSYLKCILAIAAGGAITHTLVPPTPGPLTMAANLDIDLGRMIMVGAAVALPAAIVGIFFAGLCQRVFDIPFREVQGHEEPDPLTDDQLPGLFVSVLPVILPVLMIGVHTVTSTLSDGELLTKAEAVAVAANTTVDAQVDALITETPGLSRGDALNAIRQKTLSSEGSPGFWTDARHYTQIVGNPSLALLLSAFIAIVVYVKQRKPTKAHLSKVVETSLMSGGVIILITAAGSSFGAMLKVAGVGDAIRDSFAGDGDAGLTMLMLGFGIAALLKVAQGSSTAAMIITSSMMPGMLAGVDLPFDRVYLATAIGAGSLMGSWMNDSGFWIFAKMGGLTETEALKTWTPLLVVLGGVSFAATLILSQIMPLV